MVRINLNTEGIVDMVAQQYKDGTYRLEEQGVAFLLGYHLTREYALDMAFEIGWTGPIETSFSPDLDVLALGEDPVGYEVKGLQGESDSVSKRQVYTGLGQAVALLNQPLKVEGGLLKYVYLAVPAPGDDYPEYLEQVKAAVDRTPIGLVSVSCEEYQVLLEASENAGFQPELRSRVVNHLEEQATGTDSRHPDRGMENYALEIIEDHDDQHLLL